MPLYTSIGGVRKEITSLYTGIDGVKKEIQNMYSGNDGVKETIFSAGIPLSELPVGTEILIYEERSGSGIWGSSGYYSYIIISHDYPEENTTLAMRQLLSNHWLNFDTNDPDVTYNDYYGNAVINSSTVGLKGSLSLSVQGYLKEVSWDDNGNTIIRSAVVLSEEEVSKTGLEYFQGLSNSELKARRKARTNLGDYRDHLLRNKVKSTNKGTSSYYARGITDDGLTSNLWEGSNRVVFAFSSDARVKNNILE